MALKRLLALLLSASMLIGAASQLVFADTAFSNGVNRISAVKTAQWTANGKGDDAPSKYDLLISYYSANYYQTAYLGFDLPEDFNPAFVQSAKLKLTTTKLETPITSSVYGAAYDGFENAGTYTKSDVPAFDSAAIGTVIPAAAGKTAECDVTDYLKSARGDVAFRIASGKGYSGWNIGSCNNGGTPPQLEIEYDNGEGAHTVPERIDYDNGSIIFEQSGSFEAGEKITLTVVPDEHYGLDSLVIDGKPVETNADNTYVFSMPARNVTENYIKAAFKLSDYIKTRNIYEDNMLLQRDKPVYIDGTCQNIGAATAYLYKEEEPVQEKKVTVEKDKWNVTFDAVSDYTAVYKIVIEGDNGTAAMNNVLFGDVYLFTGQSNMWKEVSYYRNTDSDYTKENVEKHLTDKIRVMYTKGSGCYGETNPVYDAAHNDAWRDFSSYSNVSPLPAVAFSAAAELYENNGNIPVGVIANAYPGSYISCWFPNTGIDPCNANRNKSFAERNWYNGRIYPLQNLELSGIFWYQGESDAALTYHDNPYAYYSDMMTRLIKDWRAMFGDEKLPFYWVQLARLGPGTTDENNENIGSAPETTIKRAQTDVYLNFEDKTNLGIAGTLDLYGRYSYPETENDANCRNDIHPGQKKLVGKRLADYALKDVYGKEIPVSGPMAVKAERSGGAVKVSYNCTGALDIMPSAQYADAVTDGKIKSGAINPDKLNEFHLAGEDGIWYAAEAEITAENQVTVTSDKVSAPRIVSYAAKNDYPEAPNLTDETGLPSYVFEMEVDNSGTPLPEENKCVKITADYNPDGSLKAVSTEEINSAEIEPLENTPAHKVFYWESLASMRPVETGTKPAVSPTPQPTPPPSGADYSVAFGTGGVTADTAYGEQADGRTYGFVGIEGALIENSRFDGFRYSQDEDLLSELKNGNDFVEADYSAYDEETARKMGEGEIPVRFALKAKKDGYYTVTATVVNTSKTEEAEVSLFSELRHFILYKRKLAPGESVTKTFNIHLASTYVSGTGVLEDEVINVCVSGRNAGLKSVSVKEETGKTIWLMTDSTGADQLSNVPYFGLQNYGGTGQVLSKYINPEVAVSNQGEGGLDTTDTVHFNNAAAQMKAGDYLYVQYGFNDSKDMNVYKRNLEKYYTEAHKKGVKLILVSPTERQNTSANWDSENKKWTASNGAYAIADREFTQAKIAAGADDIAFVDVNTAFVEWMNEAMQTMLAQRKNAGFNDTELNTRLMEYYFRCGWTFSRDSVHINEAGADNAGYLFAREAKKMIAANPDGVQEKVLSELMENAPDEMPYAVSDEIIANDWAPNNSYPYPNTKPVEFEYPAMVKSVDSSNGKLNSMTVKIQGNMNKYAQGVAEILNQNGETVRTIYTKSTDKNPAIGHIDNTAVEYGEKITMYFNESENLLNAGYTYKVYLLPIENGADKPDSEPYYSSIYTEPPKVLDKLITSADGSGSECFDYAVEEGASIKEQGANSASGAVQWQFAGSATAQTYAKAIKDGQTAAHLYTNGSGTYALTKFFNSGKNIVNGKIHMHFQINHTYGHFGIRLTSSAKIGSWMEGMQILSVEDGVLKLYDGTEAGAVKGSKWTDVDVWIDLDRCTETVSIAGGNPVTATIKQLNTSDKSAIASLLPIRGLSIMYMNDPNSLSNFAFDTYLTDLSVSTVETDTPKINVTAVVDGSSAGMGTVSGSGVFDIHSDVTLTAVPEQGYNLVGWYTADGTLYSTDKNLTIDRICQDISLTAKFVVQRSKEYITSFEIASSKQSVKAGSNAVLTPVNAVDAEGNATVEITAKDIAWNCTADGINITADGILTVSADFAIENNSVEDITVTGTINGHTMARKIPVYSYAYYDAISESADFNGTFKTIANKTAIVWPGERETSVYRLSEDVMLNKDTQIKYSNAWDGANTSGKNRVIAFKDKDGNTVFSMYYTWAVLYLSAEQYLAAVSKNTWTDVTVDISYDSGEIILSAGGKSVTGSIDKEKLTTISSIELSTPAGCPADRLLGISNIIISQ